MTEDGRRLKAGRHGYGDLRLGDRVETSQAIVTEEMIDAFAELTGDRFEIHMDEEAARRRGFAGRVAHGLLVQSLVDGLKNQAPAQIDAVASLGWQWDFRAPVLAGDAIRASITVADARGTSRPGRGIVELDFRVANQRGEIVQHGRCRLLVDGRPEPL